MENQKETNYVTITLYLQSEKLKSFLFYVGWKWSSTGELFICIFRVVSWTA